MGCRVLLPNIVIYLHLSVSLSLEHWLYYLTNLIQVIVITEQLDRRYYPYLVHQPLQPHHNRSHSTHPAHHHKFHLTNLISLVHLAVTNESLVTVTISCINLKFVTLTQRVSSNGFIYWPKLLYPYYRVSDTMLNPLSAIVRPPENFLFIQIWPTLY